MLQLSNSIMSVPVMSLRTGGLIATTTAAIINPNNLKIEGFYCQDRFSKSILILLVQDIREASSRGYIVNDHEVLAQPDELIRLKEVLDQSFELIDKPVYSLNKKKLGKVNDFAIENSSMYIQKIYVGQSLLKSFSGGQLSIDRDQIIEVTNRKIVVQDPLQPIKDSAPATVPLAG